MIYFDTEKSRKIFDESAASHSSPTPMLQFHALADAYDELRKAHTEMTTTLSMLMTMSPAVPYTPLTEAQIINAIRAELVNQKALVGRSKIEVHVEKVGDAADISVLTWPLPEAPRVERKTALLVLSWFLDWALGFGFGFAAGYLTARPQL